MAETKIIITNVHNHPETGHITYTVQSETVDGGSSWKGPLKQYGCDMQMLRDRFHGKLEEFESYIASEHKPFVGAHPEIMSALEKRKGAVIG